jgi:hypothetical protein
LGNLDIWWIVAFVFFVFFVYVYAILKQNRIHNPALTQGRNQGLLLSDARQRLMFRADAAERLDVAS